MRSVSDHIAKQLIENGIISAEDKNLYTYGIQQTLVLVINIATTLIIGLIFEMVWHSIVFLVAYIPLRSYAGGYHAKTQFRCYLLSVTITVILLMGIKYSGITAFIGLILVCISTLIIFFLAPIEDSNKPLDDKEIKVYRKRTRLILSVELLIFIVLLAVGRFESAYVLCGGFVILSVLLILGHAKNIHGKIELL